MRRIRLSATEQAQPAHLSDGAMLKVFTVVYAEESSPIGTSGLEHATEAIMPPEETAAPAAK
jgi:hypothetical protein